MRRALLVVVAMLSFAAAIAGNLPSAPDDPTKPVPWSSSPQLS